MSLLGENSVKLIIAILMLGLCSREVQALTPMEEMELAKLNQEILTVNTELKSVQRQIQILEYELQEGELRKHRRTIWAATGYTIGISYLVGTVQTAVANHRIRETETSIYYSDYSDALTTSLVTLILPGVAGIVMGITQDAGLKSDIQLAREYNEALLDAKAQEILLQEQLDIRMNSRRILTQ